MKSIVGDKAFPAILFGNTRINSGENMKYKKIAEATFISRPNRFIANVELEGEIIQVHVKNTGRCRELLIPGVSVILEESDNLSRKTKYDLVCVKKNQNWINMDSQLPNKAAAEWIRAGGLFPEPVQVYTEKTYGNSRFDLYIESEKRKAFIEVKGVTLEEEGIASFPDAPTVRGIKHLNELVKCMEDGYEAYVLFVIQMKGIHAFKPNWRTHKEFGEALNHAFEKGVTILAYDCEVTEDSMNISEPVLVDLEKVLETTDVI